VTTISQLNDHVLLDIFDWCRRLDNATDDSDVGWNHERWWYRLIQVCQHWRHIILSFPTHLDLHLVCTYGTPVEAMLDHSPPFPLILYYPGKREAPATMSDEDKRGAIFALRQRERVRRVHIAGFASSMHDLVEAMDGEYPTLKRLIVRSQAEPNTNLNLTRNRNRNRRPPNNAATVRLPAKLRAPVMRRLVLSNVALPGSSSSQLLSSSGADMDTLGLIDFPASSPSEFDPAHLTAQLATLSRLERLTIYFGAAVPNREVWRMLQGQGATTRIVLPRLRILAYRGSSAYLDRCILARFDAPNLLTLNVELFYQPTLSLPSLLRFARATEALKFNSAALYFEKTLVSLIVDPLDKLTRGPGDTHPLHMQVKINALDAQVPSITHICSALAPSLAQMESLELGFHKDGPMTVAEAGGAAAAAAGWQVGEVVVDRAQWRALLRIFVGVKTLQVTGGHIGDLFRALQVRHSEGNGDDGGNGEDGDVFAPEILPSLERLVPRGWGHTEDAFASFITAREAANRPVRLIRSRM
jgi:hypothetical protein